MADERRLDVLRAIVEDYVATHEPVGSRSLLDRHQLGVSPATIRNDMAILEEEGYISQPHTSAGRIPTEKGYRIFVDRLATVKPLSAAERRAIETFLQRRRRCRRRRPTQCPRPRQLTNQIAIVQYPSLSLAAVRHIEIVPLENARMLVVVITSSGRVEQRIIELADTPDEALVSQLRARLTGATVGQRLGEASSAAWPKPSTALRRDIARSSPRSSRRCRTHSPASVPTERIAVGGTANLARFGHDFDQAIQPVLEALEEQVVLLRLLGEATDRGPQVRIGSETGTEGLATDGAGVVDLRRGRRRVERWARSAPPGWTIPARLPRSLPYARYVGRLLNEGHDVGL